jgi:DNA-binding response OmpR family regulator
VTHGHTAELPAGDSPEPDPLTVLVYSDDAAIRRQVMLALGRTPARGLPEIEYIEVATEPVVHRTIGAGGIDLAILDGEAWPAGGMGIGRQLKDEQVDPPPVLLLIGRRDDAWLAAWSLADAVVMHPIDPPTLVDAAVGLLRDRDAHLPAH